MHDTASRFVCRLPACGGRFGHAAIYKFTAGRFWVDDYGSGTIPINWGLLTYSPYHDLKAGASYPATLVTTADTDDHVVPGHSLKFAARLQESQRGDAPVLIRIETHPGHGSGKPTAKIIEEIADRWLFLVKNLDMTLDRSAVSRLE